MRYFSVFDNVQSPAGSNINIAFRNIGDAQHIITDQTICIIETLPVFCFQVNAVGSAFGAYPGFFVVPEPD
jgi:hypothetical protein